MELIVQAYDLEFRLEGLGFGAGFELLSIGLWASAFRCKECGV